MKKIKLLALFLTCGFFLGADCYAKSAEAKAAKAAKSKAARDMLTVVESESFDSTRNVASFKATMQGYKNFIDSFKQNSVYEGTYALKSKGKDYSLSVKYSISWFWMHNMGVVSISYTKTPKGNNSKALVGTDAIVDTAAQSLVSTAAIIIPNKEKNGHLLVVEKEFWGGELEKHKSNAIGAIRKTFREKILPEIDKNKLDAGNKVLAITDSESASEK